MSHHMLEHNTSRHNIIEKKKEMYVWKGIIRFMVISAKGSLQEFQDQIRPNTMNVKL